MQHNVTSTFSVSILDTNTELVNFMHLYSVIHLSISHLLPRLFGLFG